MAKWGGRGPFTGVGASAVSADCTRAAHRAYYPLQRYKDRKYDSKEL